MLDALNRYQSLKTEGNWKTTSLEDEKIVALTPQIQEMKKIFKGTNLKLKIRYNQRNSNKGKNNKRKNKRSNIDKSKVKKDFDAWKKIPQKEGEDKIKIMERKYLLLLQ